MTKSLRIVFAIIYVLAFFRAQLLYSGREPEYSDRYPKFTEIVQHGSSVYFAGSWTNRYIVVEKDSGGKWYSYSCPGNKYSTDGASVFSVSDGLLFMCVDGAYEKFCLETKTWKRQPMIL